MEKLFIVDLMPFLYRGHFVFLKSPRMTSSGINTSALLGLVNGLMSIVKRERPERLVLAMDPGGPTFRHRAYPPYKAQREKMPEDLAASIPYAFEVADALGIPVVRVDDFEADDVMGAIAVKGAAAGFDVYLATPDKDAAQLVRPGVKLYRPSHSGDAAEVYDEAKVCEHWKLSSPAQMIDYLALAGDASDNIPGIRGVGEKTAADLIAKFGDVEGVIANVGKIKGKLAEKVFAGREDAMTSKFLTTIRTDVPIEPDWESYRLGAPDPEKLAAVCAKFELTRLAKEYGIAAAATAPRTTRLRQGSGGQASHEPRATSPETLTALADFPHDYRYVSTEEEARELLKTLMAAPRVAFDTETTAREPGMTATDASTCRLIGFSFATEPGRAWYVDAALVDVFRPLFADPAKVLVAHNGKFDRNVLHRYGIGFASTPHDTMLAHYCLDAAARHGMDALAERYLGYRTIHFSEVAGEQERGKPEPTLAGKDIAKVTDYAAEDADVTLRLEDTLRPQALALAEGRKGPVALSEVEEPLVKVLCDMEREGVRVDVDALKEYGRELDREILSLTQGILAYADPGFNPDSPKQLGELLFGKLGLPGGRKTSTGQFSTDEKTLAKLAGAHPVVPAILDYRACTKLKSTYVDKLPTLIDADSRVHTTYAQAFTETGRLSSSDPNLQNIPIRTERGRRIRAAFVARDDRHRIVSADYSQIELRLMAAFSGDEAMLAAFRSGADIHRETASRVYGVMPTLVSDEQRSKCKMVNFGIIYGISAFGLSQRLKVPRREAEGLIDSYFRLYPGVRDFMSAAVAKAREKGYAETMLGRRRTLRDIDSRNATARGAAERDAINTPIQGSAADLIKIAMVRVDRALKERRLRTKIVLQIHDELVFDAPEDEVDEVVELARREMTGAYDFGVPLEVGVGVGRSWLDAH